MTLASVVAVVALAQVAPAPAAPPEATSPPVPSQVSPRPAAPVPPPDEGMPAPTTIAGPLAAAPGATYPLPPAGAPALRWDRPSRCLDRAGLRWRIQCDDDGRRCLVAPDAELGPDGEPRAELDRAPGCVLPVVREAEVAARTLVPGVAEAPPGWRRDERQRVMQVNFDLNRRAWIGAGLAGGPSSQTFPRGTGGEGQAGIRWDRPFRFARGVPALLRGRALETTAAFDGSFADVLVLGLDASRAYPSPLLRITTFVGKPRRFDPPLFLGAAADVLRVETLETETGEWYDRLSGSLSLTADLWRSKDLASFVRLRAGAGIEAVDQWDGADWTPQAGADAELLLDSAGFHHLRLLALAESVRRAHRGGLPATLATDRTRYTVRAEYEVILLAVNDQPLSLVLAVRGQQRDDVPDYPTDLRWAASGALRFSLFAPARRTAPLQERL